MVGTVVSIGEGSIVVRNVAGTRVTVRVPAGTSVTTTSLTGLRPGVTVAVTGSKEAEGTVIATSVISRESRP